MSLSNYLAESSWSAKLDRIVWKFHLLIFLFPLNYLVLIKVVESGDKELYLSFLWTSIIAGSLVLSFLLLAAGLVIKVIATYSAKNEFVEFTQFRLEKYLISLVVTIVIIGLLFI